MTQVLEFDRTDPFAHVPNPWEVQLHPNSAAAWTVNVTPGSWTASVLALLDPARLSQAGRVDALVGLERLRGTWRRLVTDELGHLIDYGRTTYEPPTDLAQFVIARDRTCRAPGCERPAAKSDLHHVQWWSRGGETNAGNLVAACERNHYAVHNGGWEVTREPDGTTVWTSPTGHTYRVPPASYPVDSTTKIKNDNDGSSDEEAQSTRAGDETPPF